MQPIHTHTGLLYCAIHIKITALTVTISIIFTQRCVTKRGEPLQVLKGDANNEMLGPIEPPPPYALKCVRQVPRRQV